MSDQLLFPADFAVPDGLTAEEFRLEPLGRQHNAADYAAWTASISHIQATPGFAARGWPHEMSRAENLRDLERHARDFAERRGFTYTVLSTGTGEVIGCVYIYPPRGDSEGSASAGGEQHAAVSSWVRADCARARPGAVPHGPRMAGTRLAVPLDRVRATGLTCPPRWPLAVATIWHPGRPRPARRAANDDKLTPARPCPQAAAAAAESASTRHNSLLCVATAADLTRWRQGAHSRLFWCSWAEPVH